MDFKKFNSTWANTIASNRIMVVANAALVVVVFMQAMTIASSKERVILTPTHLSETMTVAWNEATPGYYKAVALWLSGLLAEVKESNLTFVKDGVQDYFAPGIRRELFVSLDTVASDPLRKINGQITAFEARELLWEKATKKVFVTGDLVTYSAGKGRGDRMKVTYEYMMKMNSGLPVVTSFNSYSGLPRTLGFLNENQVEIAKNNGDKSMDGLVDFGEIE